jgi:hypothetical protein
MALGKLAIPIIFGYVTIHVKWFSFFLSFP